MHHPTEEHPAPEPPSEEAYGEASGAPLTPPSQELPAVEDDEPLEGDTGDGPELFDFETDADLEAAEAPAPAPPEVDEPAPPEQEDEDEFDDLGPAEEGDYAEDERERKQPYEDDDQDAAGADKTGEADLLSEQPDFAEDSTDEEDLWFEQGPPKDFDFEDEK